MKIAFLYEFDDKSWPGGRNYYASLFAAVHMVDPSLELLLLTGRKTTTSLPEQFPRLQVVRESMLDRWSLPWIRRQFGRSISRTTDPALERLLLQHRVNVLSHSGGLPNHRGIKTLGWLPDFQFMYFPHYWKSGQLRRTRRTYVNAVRFCDALVVSSGDALADLDKFAPHGHAPAHVLHFIAAPAEVEKLPTLAQITSKYGLPDRYLHLPNQFWVHKNHRVVIDALAELGADERDIVVVCTGQPSDVRNPAHYDNLIEHATKRGVAERFRVLGLVPYADMQALMLHARAILNPSRFEGWSTTVEEAKALGKRILLSDLPVHREQAPEGAFYFSPDDPVRLARLIRDAANTGIVPVDAQCVAAAYQLNIRNFGEKYLDILRSL